MNSFNREGHVNTRTIFGGRGITSLNIRGLAGIKLSSAELYGSNPHPKENLLFFLILNINF
jgi:hypothetical protein